MARSPHHQTTIATVRARVPITARLTRLTLSAPQLIGVRIRPAQDLELHVPDQQGVLTTRRYTVRHARPGTGEVDLDIVTAGHDGPGVRWASTAPIGSTVACRGPRGKLEIRPADWFLFVGDEASLPAIAALAESVTPSGADARAILEVAGPGDELPIAAATRWLHRHGTALDAVRRAVAGTALPAGRGQLYLLGESRLVKALRDDLLERGVPDDRVFAKGYWTARPARIAR